MNKLIDNLILGIAAMAVLTALSPVAFAQGIWTTAPPAKPAPPSASPRPDLNIETPELPYPAPHVYFGGTYERSIKVDSNVYLSLGCVTEGTIKVNGWNRNEVRVMIEGGTRFAFRVAEKSPKTGAPVWIKVIGTEPKGKYGQASECVSGSEIEIDAPVNATLTIKGNEVTTRVDLIRRVEIETLTGGISLRNISNGVTAVANQGDVTVEGASGPMNLSTTTGNIFVFDAGPSEFGDVFKANTNSGLIALQQLKYRQTNVVSITGSVSFTGEILSGGSYSLRTSKGSIRMSLPALSSFQLYATYGAGTFDSEVPVKIATENISEGPVKTIVGKAGSGDAVLKLTTNNGSIAIKKQL